MVVVSDCKYEIGRWDLKSEVSVEVKSSPILGIRALEKVQDFTGSAWYVVERDAKC